MNVAWKTNLASGLKWDLVANLAGVAWPSLLQFAFVPLYLKKLGIDAFGLIGFYLMTQAVVSILDFGLSPTVNREMARYSVQPHKAAEARDLVRTVESGYWLIGFASGAIIIVASHAIATHWIKPGSVSAAEVQRAIRLIGVLVALQWPISFYQGGLMGLGHQVLCNGVNICFSTISSTGSLCVLYLISPTIHALFLWLVILTAMETTLIAALLWRNLPKSDRPSRFDKARLQSIRAFAAGMTGITLCSLLLMQSDKLIISKLFSLGTLGYYSLAGMFGSGLSMIVTSVFNTIFPRFSALAAVNEEELRNLYFRSTQLLAVLIFPLAAVMSVFSNQILQIWTRNAEIARNAGPIMTLLVIGSALNGLSNTPYALQLAYGWTSLPLRINIFIAAISVPGAWLLANHFGPLGAACVWPGLNVIYMVIAVPLTHRRLLKGEAVRWYAEAALPLVAILPIVFLGRVVVTNSMSMFSTVVTLMALLLFATGGAAFISPSIRPWLLNQLERAKMA